MISISIVSHRHGPMARRLISDLDGLCAGRIEIILTENVPESPSVDWSFVSGPVKVLRNSEPRGFGANHNSAFRQSSGEFFCVLNPDVRLTSDPFPELLRELSAPRTGVVAPLIVDSCGAVQDSARRFPTPASLLRKALGSPVPPDYAIRDEPFSPDWVAGMFMVFPREVFREIEGFDERYFLYYEDVDLCARLRRKGYEIRLNPRARAIHDAQRDSHRDLAYLATHLRSALRYLLSRPQRRL
jgi:N-acetylglucosaminyl-diphospho-decaprenol L-rhamnosyltransferase